MPSCARGPNTANGTVTWVYHDPAASNQLVSPVLQFNPPPQSAANQPVTLWVKIGYSGQPQKAFVYYTTNGTTYPEGSAGVGKGTTQVAEMTFDSNGPHDGTGLPDWWKATLPAMSSSTVLRYKIGVYRNDASSWFPFSANDITMKKRMETVFQITNFNGQAVSFYPHNDYGVMKTGLDEGFHLLRSETFLKRDNPTRSSIYNLNVQTIYYDTKTPEGEILTPAPSEIITNSSYAVVVRTDRGTTEAWVRITDSNGTSAWTRATQISPPTPGLNTIYPLEWRFNYIGIPNNGASALIEVRLRELSSSTNLNLTDDVTGHFTRLTRTVFTGVTLDHVGDGIPDSWRQQYFGGDGMTTNNQSCATCDPDGDGMGNLAEFVAGTSPIDSESAFRITSIVIQPDGDQEITWHSVPGKNYQVWAATGLSEVYLLVSPPIPSAGSSTTFADTIDFGSAQLFFKVKVLP